MSETDENPFIPGRSMFVVETRQHRRNKARGLFEAGKFHEGN